MPINYITLHYTDSSPAPSKFYFCGSTKKSSEESTSDNDKTKVVVHQQGQSLGPYFYSEGIKNGTYLGVRKLHKLIHYSLLIWTFQSK